MSIKRGHFFWISQKINILIRDEPGEGLTKCFWGISPADPSTFPAMDWKETLVADQNKFELSADDYGSRKHTWRNMPVARKFPGKKTQRLIHKVDPGSILWMGREYRITPVANVIRPLGATPSACASDFFFFFFEFPKITRASFVYESALTHTQCGDNKRISCLLQHNRNAKSRTRTRPVWPDRYLCWSGSGEPVWGRTDGESSRTSRPCTWRTPWTWPGPWYPAAPSRCKTDQNWSRRE